MGESDGLEKLHVGLLGKAGAKVAKGGVSCVMVLSGDWAGKLRMEKWKLLLVLIQVRARESESVCATDRRYICTVIKKYMP